MYPNTRGGQTLETRDEIDSVMRILHADGQTEFADSLAAQVVTAEAKLDARHPDLLGENCDTPSCNNPTARAALWLYDLHYGGVGYRELNDSLELDPGDTGSLLATLFRRDEARVVFNKPSGLHGVQVVLNKPRRVKTAR